MIDGGKLAMSRRENGNPDQKDPDRVAFWTDGISPRRGSNDFEQPPVPPKEVPCLIVGDFKLYLKFNHGKLDMACNHGGGAEHEMQRVMNQIHDYMDMHHNRFGYVITERELIMFRRREGRMENHLWGHVDYSPMIPIEAESGQRNALMVLWYFHTKYAVMNESPGWRLESYYEKAYRGARNTVNVCSEQASKVTEKGQASKSGQSVYD